MKVKIFGLLLCCSANLSAIEGDVMSPAQEGLKAKIEKLASISSMVWIERGDGTYEVLKGGKEAEKYAKEGGRESIEFCKEFLGSLYFFGRLELVDGNVISKGDNIKLPLSIVKKIVKSSSKKEVK